MQSRVHVTKYLYLNLTYLFIILLKYFEKNGSNCKRMLYSYKRYNFNC